MSNRKVTRQQFSQNHAIDGSRIQSATEDVYARFNSIPISDVDKRRSLQYLVAKTSGRATQRYDPITMSLDGTDRCQAPFVEHAMKDVDNAATPAIFRAKGFAEKEEGHGFVWTVSTVFKKPVTIESFSLEIDSSFLCPFSLQVYRVTFTLPHGLSVGSIIKTVLNNAAGKNILLQRFRVISIIGTLGVTVIWHSHESVFPGQRDSHPATASDPAAPLEWTDGVTTFITSTMDDVTSPRSMRLLIDCPFMSYSTDHRLAAKLFARDEFDERALAQRKLNDDVAGVDMFPPLKSGAFDEFTNSFENGLHCYYFDAADLNVPVPNAQTVTFRVGFSSADYPGLFPAAVPRANLVIAYRERLHD